VPPGFVVVIPALADGVEDALADEIEVCATELGARRMAVRSSGAAEDLAGASHAGLFATYLDVTGAELVDAVRRCLASAHTTRVAAYQSGLGVAGGDQGPANAHRGGFAVLVQAMVAPRTAGVVFTADPISGDRGVTVVTAVRGLGESLVSGESVGQEWVVRNERPVQRRAGTEAIDADQAVAVARLARAVEAHLGGAQDIEWAYAEDGLWLLQARPMTALLQPVEWAPPGPGVWLRNVRLGEWLPEPCTPLFADWLLPRINDGIGEAMRATVGVVIPFGHATVNGWYYTTPAITFSPTLFRHVIPYVRGAIFMYRAVQRALSDPVAAEAYALARLGRDWRDRLLPDYRELVSRVEALVDQADIDDLMDMAGQIAHAAGVQFWYIQLLGGSAWKMEAVLTRFCRRYLRDALQQPVPVLLAGLSEVSPHPPQWSVVSLDWHEPTLGEWEPEADQSHPHRNTRHDREAAEQACRAALASRPRLAARFNELLAVAQRHAAVREEQARHLTLGWPALRRIAARLGRHLVEVGVLAAPDDLHFLTRGELDAAVNGALKTDPTARRATWNR
jgi:pyruvate,water dikinase